MIEAIKVRSSHEHEQVHDMVTHTCRTGEALKTL